MADVTFTVLANADDCSCNVAGGGFTSSKGSGYLEIGNGVGVGSQQAVFRFDNVTIPSTATIDSAILRLTSFSTGGTSTCSVKVHFEQADDPAAPTTDSDILGRSLDAGISWSSLSAWTAGVAEDSPELKTGLQAIIDRGGWNSGQAIQVHVVDDSSTANANRRPATYEHSSYSPAQLVVTYSLPYQVELSESITVTESVIIEKDLIVDENITLSEYVDLLLGFDESLPLISEDIEISESVTVIRGLGGIPEQFESITISEYTNVLLGFDESLPEQFESINVSEYVNVDVGPQINVFETIIISENGAIQPLISTADTISVSESVSAKRGYEAAIEDSFAFTDNFVVFHYTNWLKQNKAKAYERFFFILTGDSDQTTDAQIPVSSIFARKRTGDPTYLQVVIPSFNYADEINNRPSGDMIIEMGYEIDGEIALREQILISTLENIDTYDGGLSRSIVLSGHKTVNYLSNLVTLNRSEVIYRAVQTRARVFRFAHIDPFLNPGDTVVIGDESITADNIIYIIDAPSDRATMEIREGT